MDTRLKVANLLTRPCPRRLGFYLFATSLLLSVLMNFVFLRTDQHRNTECFDGQNYFMPMARSLWSQGVPLNRWGMFCTHQGPGYPLVLAPALAAAEVVSLKPVSVAQTLNIVLASIAVLGVFHLARRMMSWPFALIAALAFTVYPPFIWLTRDAYNEPLFAALMVWGTLTAISGIEGGKKFTLICGMILLAMATLTRAVGLLTPLVLMSAFVPGFYRNLHFWRVAFGGLLIYVAALTPWICAATRHAGHLVIATTSFAGSHIDGLVSVKGNPLSLQATSFFQKHAHETSSIIAFHRLELPSHSGSYLLLFGQKIIDSWTATEAGTGRTILSIINLPLITLTTLALWYLFFHAKRTTRTDLLLVLLLCYFWGMNILVWSTMRYMAPIAFLPLLLIARAADLFTVVNLSATSDIHN